MDSRERKEFERENASLRKKLAYAEESGRYWEKEATKFHQELGKLTEEYNTVVKEQDFEGANQGELMVSRRIAYLVSRYCRDTKYAIRINKRKLGNYIAHRTMIHEVTLR